MTSESPKADGATLRLPSGRSLVFPFDIGQLEQFDEVIVVRLEVPPGQTYNENVFGVSLTGEVLWQIPPIPHVSVDSPYVNLGRDGSNAVISNWDGLRLHIFPATGAVQSTFEGR